MAHFERDPPIQIIPSSLSGPFQQETFTPSPVGQASYDNPTQGRICSDPPAETGRGTYLPIRDPTATPELSANGTETEDAAGQLSSGFLTRPRSPSLDSLQRLPSEADTDGDSHLDRYHTHHVSPKFWNPFWLRLPILATYTSFLIAVALAFLAIYIVSLKHDGLVSVSGGTGEAYMWKYLPATVIVLLLSCWNGVDFTIRQYQPWVFLKAGPSTGDLTLNLDLVTPLLPSIIWKSIKIGAWMPATTLGCSLLLAIVRVLSTSLLAIESTAWADEGIFLTRTGAFNGTSSNSGGQTNSIAAGIYAGVSNANLAWPTWVLSNATFEPFEQREWFDASLNSSIGGFALGMFPNMRCELATLQDKSVVASDMTYQAPMEFASETCSVRSNMSLIDPTQIDDLSFSSRWPDRNYVGTFQEVTCPDRTQRYLATVTLVDSSISLVNYSAAFCTPRYFIQNTSVSVTYPERQLSLDWGQVDDNTSTGLEGLTAMSLLESVLLSSKKYSGTLGAVHQPPRTSVNNDPFLRIAASPLSNYATDTPYLELLLNSDLMAAQISQAFSGIAALLVHGSMLDKCSDPLFGSLTYTRDRVRVNPTVAFSMTAVLIFCALMCVIVMVRRPKDIVPRDPRSAAGVALLIMPSRRRLEFLFDHGYEDAEDSTRKQNFSSRVMTDDESMRFIIERSDNVQYDKSEATAAQNCNSRRDRRAWWCPMTLKTWVRVLAIVLLLATVAILEQVQRLSDRQGGITAIADSATANYASSIIPAMCMWGLAALQSSINFNTILLSPYFLLSKGHAEASRTMLSHNLGRLTLNSLLASFRQRHVSAVFTGLAAVAGSFLTIVVSGLYFTSTETATDDILMNRLDTFNTSWSSYGAYEDGGAGQLLSLIVWQNLSYPAWTYDDLTIPQLSPTTGTNSTIAANEYQTFQASVPARRAVLSCDANGPSDVTARLGPGTPMVYTNISGTCPGSTGGPFPVSITTPKQLVGFAGRVSQLFETETSAQAWFQVSSKTPPPNDPGCQSLIFFLGSFPSSQMNSTANVSASFAQVTTLACTQLIQEVTVSIHLRADLTLDTSRPPSPDETTAHFVNDGFGADANNAQEYLVSFPLGNSFTTITDDAAVLAALNSSAANLDSFFQAVALEAGFFDIESLVGEENIQVLINATSKMYGRYMAQVQSRTMRTPLNVSTESQSHQLPARGSYTRIGLYQSRTVKLALQIILGVMALCDCAAWFSMRGAGRILPHDPGSVAGVAALVGGRDLWAGGASAARVPPEWMTDEDVRTSGLWFRTWFVMRRWDDGRYGIGIDTDLPEGKPTLWQSCSQWVDKLRLHLPRRFPVFARHLDART